MSTEALDLKKPHVDQSALDVALTWERIAQAPFAVFEFGGRSVLYRSSEIVEAIRPDEVAGALEQLRAKDCAGFLAYEAGYTLEARLNSICSASDVPLIWFMVDGSREAAPPLPEPEGAWAGPIHPRISEHEYAASLKSLHEHILAGDIYQANFTFRADVSVAGHPIALYSQIRRRAEAPWSALIYTGKFWLLSFSPEMFFTIDGRKIVSRPMKGTAPADSNPEMLRSDPKQQAENLMIVDLIRNDMSRIAKPGSVQVPSLFTVETYPTVLQMTSTVTAELQDDVDPIDAIKAMFPCGSITGVPKIRAMQIIADQEHSRRNAYTGSIGMIGQDGRAAFNVAIRTLVLREGALSAEIGLGSAIIADSTVTDEWQECLRKGSFVPSTSAFSLIETMRVAEDGIIPLLAHHLERLTRSAKQFDFSLDRRTLETAIVTRAADLSSARLRLELSRGGELAFSHGPLPALTDLAEVDIIPRPVDRHDFRLLHKTSDRAFYDEARKAAGAFEVLFVDNEGFLTEGSFTNLFVPRDGIFLTPPRSRGLLPGVLREELVASGRATEADLTLADLNGRFWLGNALRGLMQATIRRSG